jgi:excisionase family DNA binding protein
MTTPERLTIQEAAALLNVSDAEVRKLIRDGRLAAEAYPLDHREILIPFADVEALQKQGNANARPRPTTLGHVALDVQSDEVEEWLEANWRP